METGSTVKIEYGKLKGKIGTIVSSTRTHAVVACRSVKATIPIAHLRTV